MILTIHEGYDKSYVTVDSKNKEFYRKYCGAYTINTCNIYRELAKIASWVNNELDEECLFEID